MIDIEFLGDLATEAGRAILEVYETEFKVENKKDDSPITIADKLSHKLIFQALQRRYPHIPVLSEEGEEVAYEIRAKWSKFWLIDPLDGTKQFVARNGEFTVNIAYVEKNRPIIGVIYLPVAQRLFLADTAKGCWEIENGKKRLIYVKRSTSRDLIRVVSSRSHLSAKVEALLEVLPPSELIRSGSALKFCKVAAGEADLYPRFGPTWEWDTAAGQAIVEAAGGVVVDFNGKRLVYNKPSLLNEPFLVASGVEWLQETGVLERVSTI